MQRYPKTDLRLSNNIVHLRTCADSCHALAELINYIAADGDLEGIQDEEELCLRKVQEKPLNSEMNICLQMRLSESTLSSSPQLSQSHIEQVNDLMADAMKESSGSESDADSQSDRTTGGATRVFFFPDDEGGHAEVTTSEGHVEESIMGLAGMNLEETDASGNEEKTSDDDFCFVDDPCVGVSDP